MCPPASDIFKEVDEGGVDAAGQDDGQGSGELPPSCDPTSSRFDVRNLLTEGVKVNHLKDLKSAARMLDELRSANDDGVEENLDLVEMKLNLSTSKTIEEMVSKLGTSEEALRAMASVVENRVLEELLTLSSGESKIPLSEWPNSLKENFFCEVVKLATRKSPVTLSFLLRLVVKDRAANVEPAHVVSVATVFAHLAQLVDRSNNALQKINSLHLKMENTTDDGIDSLAPLGLTVTARHLRALRDDLAEVSDTLHLEETRFMPEQSTIDNCDTKGHHSQGCLFVRKT